jgi:two-component system LytT family response regulator
MTWEKYPPFLSVPDGTKLIMVPVSEIMLLEADGNYTSIVLSDKKYLVARVLSTFEEILPSDFFVRVHKSFIVNLTTVSKIQKKRNTSLMLRNGLEVPISDSKKEKFFNKLGNVAIIF